MLWIDNKTIFHGFISIHERKTQSRKKVRGACSSENSLLRDFSFQNTSEHFAIRFRQSYLIWEVCDVTAIELSSKE